MRVSWLRPALVFMALGGAPPAAAAAAGFDCVIEPASVIELASPEEGVVSEILVGRGDAVTKGEVVARLESDLQEIAVRLAEIEAGDASAVRREEARVAFLRQESARVGELHESSFAATKTLEEAQVNERLARLSLEAAKLDRELAAVRLEEARAQLERRSVRSPVDGVVMERLISVGEYAHEQAPVLVIAEIDPLHVEVFVPTEHHGRIRPGMVAEVHPEQPPGRVLQAPVQVVDPVLDAASGTFGVRLALPNPDHTIPAGLKCKAFWPGLDTR